MSDIPFISPVSVRAALDALIYQTTRKSYDALLKLTCVDLYLIEEHIARATTERAYALKQILLGVLDDLYRQSRETAGLSTNTSCATLADIEALFKSDSLADSGITRRRILGILHARYYHAELELSLEQIALWVSTDKRTVRRSLERGFDILTDALIEVETQSQKYIHKHSLRSRLPPLPEPCVHRTSLLKPIQAIYNRKRHGIILVIGESGVGKTYLTTLFWHQLIEKGHTIPDQIIRLSQAIDGDDVLAQIEDQLLRGDTRLSLREYLTFKYVGIVLDLPGDLPGLDNVLAILGVIAFMICEVEHEPDDQLMKMADIVLSVGPFSKQQSNNFAWKLYEQDRATYLNPGEINFEAIYKKTGGNPLRIKRELRNQTGLGLGNDDEQWMAWFTRIDRADQRRLLEYAIRTTVKDGQMRSAHLPDVIQRLPYERRSKISALLLDWGTSNSIGIAVLRQILSDMQTGIWGELRDWLSLVPELLARLSVDDPLRSRVLATFWRVGIANGQLRYWYYLLKEPQQTISLKVGRCAVLSRIPGQEQMFDTQLREVLQWTGERGQFDVQAEAQYIRARFLQRQGHLSRSIQLLESLRQNAYISRDLAEQISLASFRVYLDAMNFDLAERSLGELARGTVEVELAWAEMLFARRHYRASLELALSLTDKHSSATLYALMAQNAARLGRIEDAFNWFAHALQTGDGDRLTLTRVENNFAATLIEVDNLMGAEHLLKWTLQQQQELQDVIGLVYTNHNFSLLRRSR